MFCVSCGTAIGGGNFCAVCGAPLHADSPPRAAPSDQANWTDEVRYDVIVAIPAIRDRIAENFAIATQSANTQKLLDRMDLISAGRSAQVGRDLAAVLQSSIARRGVKASGERAEVVQRPVGWVLADVLCRLAGCGHSVLRVQQGTDHCALRCVIAPSSRLLIGGELVVTVERTHKGAKVRAVTHLPGLIRDWGSSRRVLDHFFNNLL
jgi:hypothetical protein